MIIKLFRDRYWGLDLPIVQVDARTTAKRVVINNNQQAFLVERTVGPFTLLSLCRVGPLFDLIISLEHSVLGDIYYKVIRKSASRWVAYGRFGKFITQPFDPLREGSIWYAVGATEREALTNIIDEMKKVVDPRNG